MRLSLPLLPPTMPSQKGEAIMTDKPKVAVPYLRTSTDDKGQDPMRQLDPIKSWAIGQGVTLLPPFIDEGTSGSTDPFEREVFKKAVEEARFKGADAIVVEAPDRFTRGGPAAYYVAAHRLKTNEYLNLWKADMSLKEQEGFIGEILTAIKAAMAKEWLDRHVQATKSGMARWMAAGGKPGKPPKTFTPEEQRFIIEHRDQKDPDSWDWIANELSKKREAFEVTDRLARYRRMVSEGTVRRFYNRFKAAQSVITPDSVNTQVVKEGTA